METVHDLMENVGSGGEIETSKDLVWNSNSRDSDPSGRWVLFGIQLWVRRE